MKQKSNRSSVYIIAGSNGSGKTTFAKEFLPNHAKCYVFINADLIAGGLSPFAPESATIQAGRLMLEQIHKLANQSQDFAFETTFSGRTYLSFLRDLKKKGYRIHLFYLWVHNVDLALERIAERVHQGGHNVPVDIVRRRFSKSLNNFFNLYRPLSDMWMIFDNSTETPQLIATEVYGKLTVRDKELYDNILKTVEEP